jgi:DNA primase
MAGISRKTIEEVRQRMDILDVVSDFVSLKRAGQNYKALSPFTNEKTPSFFVVPSKGIFKDFSSGKGGDAITFVMEHEGMSYPEAIRYLAKKYGIEIQEETGAPQLAEVQERDSLYIVMGFARDYFTDILFNSEEGRAIGLGYFRERGFTDATIRKFELGYSPDEWNHFEQHALSHGFRKEILEKAGLVVTRSDGGSYDRFRGRVIFPVHNLSGKVIAFGARLLPSKPDEKGKQPKYINSPETDIYQKGHALYGLYQARHAIRKEDFCYVVEGYTDVLSLHQAGIENVVASSGTALTEEQIRLIRRFTRNITVLFDGDEAGVRASLRGIDLILKNDLNVRIVMLPPGEDPDSFAQKNPTSVLHNYLKKNTRDFISFKIDLYKEEAQRDPIRKAEAIREIIASIAIIPDPIKRSLYMREAGKMLDVPENILIAELNKILIQERRKQEEAQERLADEAIAQLGTAMAPLQDFRFSELDASYLQQLQERETIRLLLNYAEMRYEDDSGQHRLREFIVQELEEVEFTHPVYREIFRLYREGTARGMVVDSLYFMENGSEEVKKTVAELLTFRYTLSRHWRDKYHIYVPLEHEEICKVAENNILHLKFRYVQKIMDENLARMKNATGAELDECLEIHEELKRTEQKITSLLGIVITR